MISSDAVRALLFAILLAILLYGRSSSTTQYGTMLAILTLSNVAAQFFNPARAALMQVIIPPDRRIEAASSAMFALTGVAMVATTLGPIIFAILGPALSAVVCIAAYLLSLTMTYLVADRPVPSSGAPDHFWSDFAGGLRMAWGSGPLRAVLFGIVLYGISLGINNTAIGLYSLKTLGLPPSRYGLLSMMFPAGNLVSAIVGVRLVKRVGMHRAYVLSLIGLGVGYLFFGLSHSIPVAFVMMFLCGLVFSIYVMCQGPIVQEATPAGYMGRITAITSPATAISSAVGTVFVSQLLSLFIGHTSAVSGHLPNSYGAAIATGAVCMLIGGVIMLAAQRRRSANSPQPQDSPATSG